MGKKLFGCVEGGGTKFICAIANADGQILAEFRYETTTPQATLQACAEFFEQNASFGALTSLGVACFGPLDPNHGSPTFGRILQTPKPGWSNVDVVGYLSARLHLPVLFDTDVNGAVLAEQRWGAGRGIQNIVYYTIGTGIGGGVISDGKLVHGALHTELGHMLIPHDLQKDPFAGVCPFHGDCLEGLASGPALRQRWQTPAEHLPPTHPAWELEAEYLAAALHNTACMFSPERIILGGGVISQTHLLAKILEKLDRSLHGYLRWDALKHGMDNFVVQTPLEGQAGVLGALALARQIET